MSRINRIQRLGRLWGYQQSDTVGKQLNQRPPGIFPTNRNYNKILEFDWSSAALI